MRIIALDIGDRRIGAALSDPVGIIATPHSVIERTGEAEDVAALVKLIESTGAGEVLIGMPLTLRGEMGDQAEKTHAFAMHLTKHIKIPVTIRDERMTTVSARRLIKESGKKQKNKTDDAQAAAVLLQSYLDEKS